MYQLREIVSHCRDLRESFVANVTAIEEGVYTLRENNGVYWVDATEDWRAKLKGEIQKLDALIAAYEDQEGAGVSNTARKAPAKAFSDPFGSERRV